MNAFSSTALRLLDSARLELTSAISCWAAASWGAKAEAFCSWPAMAWASLRAEVSAACRPRFSPPRDLAS